MKIMIAYPPLEGEKGTPLLSQNRQFQWFKSPTYIYPVVPAQAATLLKENGYEVVWSDGIAEGLTYRQWLDFVKQEKPDLIAMETKTPVVKQHWKIISDLKNPSLVPRPSSIVLFGDHITALPEESMQNSKVDFILTGGDYDFLLLNLCNYLSSAPPSAISHQPSARNLSSVNRQLRISPLPTPHSSLEPGIYYRHNGQIKNTGPFELNHDLNSLPFIDRDLTKWQLYAYENGNYKRTPGTYIMSGRDCWYGKCTFCLHPSTAILTSEGQVPISQVVESVLEGDADKLQVLTHKGSFQTINRVFKRHYEGTISNLEFYALKQSLRVTPNHKIYTLKRARMKRCSKRCSWDYLCIPGRKSNRLNCTSCKRKYYQHYSLKFIPAEELEIGDFVAIPIIREVKDMKELAVSQALNDYPPTFVKTDKRIADAMVTNILDKYNEGLSQRKIAELLKLDRQTVKRYVELHKGSSLDEKQNPLVQQNGYIKFEKGKRWLPDKIPLSRDFMRLIGYYLAEGHVSRIKNRPNSYALTLTFSDKEKVFIDDVERLTEKIFPTLALRKHRNQKNNTVQISINSSLLAKLFKNLFGHNCYYKKIPESFLYLALDKQKELLRGLFRGDGHLRVRKEGLGGSEYIFETVSPILAQQVLTLLFRNEAIPRFRVCSPNKKATVPKYSLSLSQYDIEELFPEISLPQRKTKYRHSFILNNFVMVPIKRISKERYNEPVYNLEVNQDHSYLANNVAVSNCSWPQLYPQFRVRKPENVLDEIGMLIERYGVREVMDDTGTFPVGKWLKEFCQGMIDRGYNRKVKIDCNMRPGRLTEKQYQLMDEAGFRLILYGLESADQNILDKINKGTKADDIVKDCRMAKEAGLEPHITCMVGYPWETRESAQKTIELARTLFNKGWVDTLQATIVMSYPGTSLFEECKKNGWLLTEDWDRYDMKEPVIRTEMSNEEILSLTQDLYKSFVTPRFILRKILSTRSMDDVRFLGRAGKAVLGHLRDFSRSEKS